VFARSAHYELILGHGGSLADDAHFEQVFVRAGTRDASRGDTR
jgi:hypothetical protein